MSLFNLKTKRKQATRNLADGPAYKMTPEFRLLSLVLTNFVQDQYYRSADQSIQELKQLLETVDPTLAAKTAIFARHEYGMRSITHALAAALARRASGTAWGARFYDRVVRRPDDMLEIAAFYLNQAENGSNLTNAMKKGFATAMGRFDAYQLAKYRAADKAMKLVDLVNLVRPKPNERNAEALQLLVADKLRNTQTWEAKLSAAGQGEEVASAKSEAWLTLLREGKLGYFALVRNLRNLLALNDQEVIQLATTQLVDRDRIKRSLVLPFRLLTAYKQLPADGPAARKLLLALEQAIDISIDNLPDLPNTLVAVDNSGSMASPIGGSAHIKCNELGAIFGLALARRSNADLMEFGTTARYINFKLRDNLLAFGAKFERRNRVGYGTNLPAVLAKAKTAYDRIVILTDMQSWIGDQTGQQALLKYRKRTGANPFVYTIDLRGYGTSQFDGQYMHLAGFSEKVFDLMGTVEQDPNVLLQKIEAVAL